MADMLILRELYKDLREVDGVREVFYSRDGEYHVFVVFLDPAHYESGEQAYERWLDFDNSNCERLKTDVDISTYTAERLETFKQKGFKEFQA